MPNGMRVKLHDTNKKLCKDLLFAHVSRHKQIPGELGVTRARAGAGGGRITLGLADPTGGSVTGVSRSIINSQSKSPVEVIDISLSLRDGGAVRAVKLKRARRFHSEFPPLSN